MHYTLFEFSLSVKDFLYANGVDPDMVNLNDSLFFKKVINIMVSNIKQSD